MESISLISIFTQNLTLPSTIRCNIITYLKEVALFSQASFSLPVRRLHTHLPIYCCAINTIAYHFISIVYDYVKQKFFIVIVIVNIIIVNYQLFEP